MKSVLVAVLILPLLGCAAKKPVHQQLPNAVPCMAQAFDVKGYASIISCEWPDGTRRVFVKQN